MSLSRATLIGLRVSWRHPPVCRGSGCFAADSYGKVELCERSQQSSQTTLGPMHEVTLAVFLLKLASLHCFSWQPRHSSVLHVKCSACTGDLPSWRAVATLSAALLWSIFAASRVRSWLLIRCSLYGVPGGQRSQLSCALSFCLASFFQVS